MVSCFEGPLTDSGIDLPARRVGWISGTTSIALIELTRKCLSLGLMATYVSNRDSVLLICLV